MEKKRCIDCGYLAVRDKESRQLEEAERNETGNIAFPDVRRWGGGMAPKNDLPICFARNCNLQSEYGAKLPEKDAWEAKIRQVLIERRLCSDFTPWIQGFTPKEHREMIDRQWMQKHLEEREDADRKWRGRQENSHSRQEWLRYVFLGIVTIVATLIATGKIH